MKTNFFKKILALTVVLLTLCLTACNSQKEIKYINHRGYSQNAPENTLTAYLQSAEVGYKYVECDVDFTKDGVPVLLHDSTIKRTSNSEEDYNVRELTYVELLTYDFGYPDKFGDKYKGEKIPTLYEFLDLCVEFGIHPYIELKNQGGEYAYTDLQILAIVDAVKKSGLQNNYTYISFSYDAITRIKNADPTARLGYLVNKITEEVISETLALKTGKNEVFLDVKFVNITSKAVKLAKNANLPVEAWTINTEAFLLLLNPYVSGVTTDKLI